MTDQRLVWFIALLIPVAAWSWITPHDRFAWLLEAAPAVAGVPSMVALRKRWPFSTLVLDLLCSLLGPARGGA
jgi:putative membrane protein